LNDNNKKRKEITISNIIAETFIENPNEYKFTIHKDGNHLNNSVENIEWSSKRDTSQKIYQFTDDEFVDYHETIYVLLNSLSDNYSQYLEMSKKIYEAIESEEVCYGYKWCFEKESYILSPELVGENSHTVAKDGLILHNGIGKPMRFIKINDKKYKVGYLIASTFIENPYNCEKVKHKDGDEMNNHIDNLEWNMNTQIELNHEEEIWRSIPEIPDYECSDNGNIRHKMKRKNMILINNKNTGYPTIKIIGKNLTVHRVVAQLFIPNPENKLEVDHIDKVRDNCHVNNLRWMTRTEQMTNTKERKKKDWPEMKIKRIDMKTDETIEEYKSQYEATQWIIDNNKSKSEFKEITKRIMVVCRGERPSMYGYKWKFSEDNEQNNEEWKEIDPEMIDGATKYKASNMGRIKDPNGNIHEGSIKEKDGYKLITIKRKNYLLHRIIAKVFIKINGNKDVVNHKDSDRTNCKVNNLEWVTTKENLLHSAKSGNHNLSHMIKAIDKKGNETEYFSIREAERQLNISQINIRRCLKKEREEIKGYKFVYA
jgi:hypothetical protein